MKQIISVRSNAFYTQKPESEKFELLPVLELVLIYTDGKTYEVNGSQLEGTEKFTEARLLVGNEILQQLITELQLHQNKLKTLRDNAEQINALVGLVSKPD